MLAAGASATCEYYDYNISDVDLKEIKCFKKSIKNYSKWIVK